MNVWSIAFLVVAALNFWLFYWIFDSLKQRRNRNAVLAFKSANSKRLRVFLSYQVDDIAAAMRLRDALGESGLNVTMFDPRQLWSDPIESVIVSMAESVLVIIVEPSGPESPWVAFERQCASKLGLSTISCSADFTERQVRRIAKSARFNHHLTRWNRRASRYFSSNFIDDAEKFSRRLLERGIVPDYINRSSINSETWWDSVGNPTSPSIETRFGLGFEYDGGGGEWWKVETHPVFAWIILCFSLPFGVLGLISIIVALLLWRR